MLINFFVIHVGLTPSKESAVMGELLNIVTLLIVHCWCVKVMMDPIL